MSNDDYLRRQAEEAVRRNPQTQKVTEQQVSNYDDRTVINNAIEQAKTQPASK